MVMLPVLRRRRASRRFLKALWGATFEDAIDAERTCPDCGRAMRRVPMRTSAGAMPLEVCRPCAGVWFDHRELESVPEGDEPLDPEARKALALAEVEWLASQSADGDAPDAAWKTVPAILGMPVESETRVVSAWPVATVATVAVLAGMYLFTDPRAAVADLGFHPSAWWKAGGLTMLTSFLVHAGGIHLLANLYFLFVFGDDVEAHLGPKRFLVLLLGAHLGGVVLHGLLDPDLRFAGASAGAFGVLGYYAVAFPTAKISFLGSPLLRWRLGGWSKLPAWEMLIVFAGLQAAGTLLQIVGFTSTSALSCLGGMAVGAGAALRPRFAARREGSGCGSRSR
jgi:membrane associated rhomboid family serine protease